MLQEEEQMLVNMKKILEIAEAEGYAIPCINTPNEETVRAVIGAAEELNTPIIIDHAQVHDSLIPIERIGPIMLKYAKEARVPVCVHLDHGSDYEFVMRAVKVGFPSIMYDCSALPFEENVEKVAQFVKFAHAAGITVEAELGIMASTDEDTHDDDPEKRVLTNEDIREFFTEPAEAKEFAERTKCDALAVCFGTMHGIYAEPPVLFFLEIPMKHRWYPYLHSALSAYLFLNLQYIKFLLLKVSSNLRFLMLRLDLVS